MAGRSPNLSDAIAVPTPWQWLSRAKAEFEIADDYGRAGWSDRIGPVQHPVWAKNVVAGCIAIDDAGLVGPKLPPDLDPETRSRRSPLAGEFVGRGNEARRFVADRSKLLMARAGGRGRKSRGRHAGEGQQHRRGTQRVPIVLPVRKSTRRQLLHENLPA